VLTTAAFTITSSAAVFIQENFDGYGSTDRALAGFDGGTGFTSAWTDVSNTTPASTLPGYDAGGNLTYSATGYVNTGSAGASSGSAFSNGRIEGSLAVNYTGRSTSVSVAQNSGDVWFSFLLEHSQVNDATFVGFGGTSNLFDNGSTSNSGAGGQDVLTVGINPARQLAIFAGTTGGLAGANATSAAITSTGTQLLVGRYTTSPNGSGQQFVNLWLNPTNVSSMSTLLSTTPTLSATRTTGDIVGAFTKVNVALRQDAANSPSAIDAIRIGINGTSEENFALAMTAVPEPGTAVFLGFGALALASHRRRRSVQ
jgi:hypothetical protein